MLSRLIIDRLPGPHGEPQNAPKPAETADRSPRFADISGWHVINWASSEGDGDAHPPRQQVPLPPRRRRGLHARRRRAAAGGRPRGRLLRHGPPGERDLRSPSQRPFPSFVELEPPPSGLGRRRASARMVWSSSSAAGIGPGDRRVPARRGALPQHLPPALPRRSCAPLRRAGVPCVHDPARLQARPARATRCSTTGVRARRASATAAWHAGPRAGARTARWRRVRSSRSSRASTAPSTPMARSTPSSAPAGSWPTV